MSARVSRAERRQRSKRGELKPANDESQRHEAIAHGTNYQSRSEARSKPGSVSCRTFDLLERLSLDQRRDLRATQVEQRLDVLHNVNSAGGSREKKDQRNERESSNLLVRSTEAAAVTALVRL